jgi:hypothetical protein
MDTYFLQFYREESYLYGDEMFVNYLNGLSYVWDQLKEKGNLVWKNVDDETPLTDKGIIYASVWYTKSLRLLHKWAKEYPDLQVYVCGPLVLHYGLSIGKDLPNFHVSNQNAEDLLCNGEVSNWNLEIPNIEKPIGYSVSVVDGYGCYWGKCRYCKITGKLKYRNIDHIPIIETKSPKYIWIHAYSLPPSILGTFYPQFENRDDIKYATYVRGDKYITDALRTTLPELKINPKNLGFNVGIEFPSNSMLEYMDKGVTVEEYLEFIKLACENDIRLHFNFILGWKNTTEEHLKDVEYFLNSLYKISIPNTITANIYPLTVVKDRKIISDYEENEIEPLETDYDVLVGNPILNNVQLSINNRIRMLYREFPFLKLHDWIENNNKHKVIHYGLKE